MKPFAILATFIAIAGAQGGRQTSAAEQDLSTAIGTATGADSITDTALPIATDSASTHRRPVAGSRTRGSLETPTDSGIDAEATSTLDDESTDTWTDDGFTPGPSMLASQPLSVPHKFTGIAGPPTIYASTSMLPAATPIANPGRTFNNAGSRVGMSSSKWLVMGLIAAVAATLL